MQIKNLVWFGHFSYVLLVKYTDLKSYTSWNNFLA